MREAVPIKKEVCLRRILWRKWFLVSQEAWQTMQRLQVSWISFNFICLVFGCTGFLLLRRLFCGCSKQGLLSSWGVWASNCGGSAGKESSCNAGDLGSIPGLGRSPGGGNDYPLQYSGLENFMDCIVHGVTKSRAWLRHFHFHSCWEHRL